MSNKLLDLIESSNAKWVDFRFTDTRGKEQHISFPASTVDEDVMEDGKMFDGSSIAGWKGIEASDMILRPDPETAFVDPFFDAVIAAFSMAASMRCSWEILGLDSAFLSEPIV